MNQSRFSFLRSNQLVGFGILVLCVLDWIPFSIRGKTVGRFQR